MPSIRKGPGLLAPRLRRGHITLTRGLGQEWMAPRARFIQMELGREALELVVGAIVNV